MLDIDPAAWPVLNELLDRAMDVPPESRRAWLDALPAQQAPYRDTLMRLLAEHDGGVETKAMFAELPRAGVEAIANRGDAVLAEGDRVGPYVLIAPVGRGGMGSVWLAERADSVPRRKVALKLPHLGWAPGMAERVERERDIVASLEHPHIARLYDAGIDALGRPYLALEYVDGTPIDRYAAEHRLSVADRLRLFLQVTEAVAHAHAHLVVHRDLKPSNILVSASGEVHLLDFGIAKLLDDIETSAEASELTKAAGRALTPEYASPEQIRGDAIGTASDVYSLGVVAYELLAGKRPYALGNDGAHGLVEAIARADVPPASRSAADLSTRRQLAGDLDAILNKALKKVPAERYVTVAAFADDVRRHLDSVPVLARPDTLGYRVRKFMSRNAVPVAAASAVLVALIVGAGVAVWQARLARAEASRADQTKNFALSFFQSADTDHGTGATTSAVDLLVDAERRVDTELKDKPAIAAELMRAIAESLAAQNKAQQASELLRRTIALSTATFGLDDPRTLGAEGLLGSTLIDLGRIDEAQALLVDTVVRARRVGARRELVLALTNLGTVQVAKDQVEEGIANTKAAAEMSDTAEFGNDKALASHAWLAYAYALNQASRRGILAAARRAIELDQAQSGGRVTGTSLQARGYYAAGLTQEDRDREALAEFEHLLADASGFYGPNHREVALIANQLGMVRLGAGYPDLAAEAYRRALEIDRHAESANPLAEAIENFNLGKALFAGARWAEALAAFDRAIAILRSGPASSRQLLWQAEMRRGAALVRLGRADDAERAFAELGAQPLDPNLRAFVQDELAGLRTLQGRHREAIGLAREALAAFVKKLGPRGRAGAQMQLGAALLAAGQAGEAIAPLREALALHKEHELGVPPEQTEIAALLARAEQAVSAPVPSGSAASRSSR